MVSSRWWLAPPAECRRAIPASRAGLFGLDEIAVYLGITYRTVQTWINNLDFPCFRLPNGVYYTTRDAVSMWVIACAEADRQMREERRAEGKQADNKMFYPGRHIRDSLAALEADLPSLDEIYEQQGRQAGFALVTTAEGVGDRNPEEGAS